MDKAIRLNKIIMITSSGLYSENECGLLCHGLSATYFYFWENVFMLSSIRCSCDLLCRSKGKILCWILKCKFYGSQKAFWESDEAIEGRDQQVIKEWGKSMRVIIRVSAV